MTRSAIETKAPSILVVADLGSAPSLAGVTIYLQALDRLWPASSVGTIRPHNPRARVVRLRLESPFEVVLAAMTEDYKPLAYGLGAALVFERSIRLIMEWQKHRAELNRDRSSEGEPAAGGLPAGVVPTPRMTPRIPVPRRPIGELIVSVQTEPSRVERNMHLDISDADANSVEKAVHDVDEQAELIEVHRLDG